MLECGEAFGVEVEGAGVGHGGLVGMGDGGWPDVWVVV